MFWSEASPEHKIEKLKNPMSSDITKRIEENSYTVGVIGLGYVGIPLSLCFARKGIRVIGFDIDEGKISSLSEGKSYLELFIACQRRLLATNE